MRGVFPRSLPGVLKNSVTFLSIVSTDEVSDPLEHTSDP